MPRPRILVPSLGMGRSWWAPVAGVVVGASAVGCGDAEVTGGEPRLDGGAPAAEDDAGGVGGGATFTDLYRDFFGPRGAAACGGAGCHGTPTAPGAAVSNFVCSDQATCAATMSTELVGPSGLADPEASLLFGVLRRELPDGGTTGFMPQAPTYAFSPASMERVRTWIAAGARND